MATYPLCYFFHRHLLKYTVVLRILVVWFYRYILFHI